VLMLAGVASAQAQVMIAPPPVAVPNAQPPAFVHLFTPVSHPPVDVPVDAMGAFAPATAPLMRRLTPRRAQARERAARRYLMASPRALGAEHVALPLRLRPVQPRLAASPRALGAEHIPERRNTPRMARARVVANGNVAQTFCLAIALYHEARGEPLEGQAAVAATIFNRVASRAYPDTICDVVYENAERRNACQFSFACDGRSDEPKNLKSFRRMAALARMFTRMVDARGAVRPEMARRHPLLAHYMRKYALVTHYHRHDVNPRWSRRMQRVGRAGAHVFFIAERVLKRMPEEHRLIRIRFQQRPLPALLPAL